MRCDFFLGIPRGAGRSGLPSIVSRPVDALGSCPVLWHSRATPCREIAGQGFVLGFLFERVPSGEPAPRYLDIPPQCDLRATARYLTAHYWGGYLAILWDREAGSLAVLPDPSGLLPVFKADKEDGIVLTTDPSRLGAPVDFGAVGSHLLRPELRGGRTCLEGVEELVPGMLAYLPRGSGPDCLIWEPKSFFPRRGAPGIAEAAEELRGRAVSVMRSWSGVLGKASVATSGGVDSSLVCAALAQAGASFECINVATSDPSGDERGYAAAVAGKLGVGFRVRGYDPDLFDPARSASLGLPRPARRSFLMVLDRVLDDAMREIGASIVFDGNNGDNLFCYLHSSAPVFDRLCAHGPGIGALRTLLDMCRITGCSVPTMLAAVGRRALPRAPVDPWPADTSLLCADVRVAAPEPLVDRLHPGKRIRSGKDDHLRLLMRAQNHVHGLTGPLWRFSPLASQPLVEFCLGVPSWVWCHGGRNRAPARAAFARELPASIVGRTSKAGPDSFIRAAFARNRAAIRERLLDGLLAANGLIDHDAVEKAVAVDEVTDIAIVDRLLDLLEAENWSRSWCS